jgi:DNA-binding transcriptional LysR family regulator
MVNLRTFDLNLIRVFEAISLDRSVSSAADKLGLSQSAVSNALNRLRRELDDPLFVRTRRGMQPTPRAQELTEIFQAAMSSIRGGLSAGSAFEPSTAERCFNLLMTDVGEILFLPVILEKLNRLAPGIDLNIMQAGIQRYEELLESGLADLAIGRIKLADTLNSELIHSSPFVVLASSSNRFLSHDGDGRPTLTFEDYLAAPHVNIEWQGHANNPLRRALGTDASRRRLALSIPHTTVLPMILERTDLMATIPKVFADKLLTNQALCTCPAPFPIEQNFVYQWWHRRNDSDPGNTWLRSLFSTAGV